MAEMMMNDAYWEAIITNNRAYDGQFYYAISTTRIYCLPSCRSKAPNRGNVRLFSDPESAQRERYRPCKRCKPDGRRQPAEEWVEHMMQLINERYAEPLTLRKLAEMVHGSPYHVLRTFKRLNDGRSPGDYLRHTRLGAAKRLLLEQSAPVAEIARSVGIPNAAHFAAMFRTEVGVTPTQYRRTRSSDHVDYER